MKVLVQRQFESVKSWNCYGRDLGQRAYLRQVTWYLNRPENLAENGNSTFGMVNLPSCEFSLEISAIPGNMHGWGSWGAAR